MVYFLIQLVIIIAILAIAWWAISKFPLPEPLRMVVIAVITILAILWLAQASGMLAGGSPLRVR